MYGNKREPAFPYDAIAKHLVWVPEYIENLTPKRGRNRNDSSLYTALLNTFLVFVRARTSTLEPNCFESICRTFVNRLNQILLSLPESLDAKHHEIEIVRRLNGRRFFITCKHSPRFNWKRNLTYREIGLNLDFAAAGHNGYNVPSGSRMMINIFEVHKSAHSYVMNEVILRDHAPNIETLIKFIHTRTTLFNSSMEQLNLPYRFDSLIDFDTKRSEVKNAVKTFTTPPSAEWWAEHYLAFRKTPYDMAYCSANSRFAHYWEVLCIVRDFDLEYDRLPSGRTTVEYSENVEKLFELVYTTIEGHENKVNLSVPSPKEFERQIVGRLRFLVVDSPSQPASLQTLRKSDLKCFLDGLRETLKMRTKERWKLRTPLVHNGVTEVGPQGHELFRVSRKQTSLISSVGGIFFSSYEE